METAYFRTLSQGINCSSAASPAFGHPRYAVVRSAVDRLAREGFTLTPPMDIREWDGDAHHGAIVQLDAATYAIHVGRGCYFTLDIERDLNGIRPSEAPGRFLCRSGNVREPDRSRSHSAN